MVALLFKIQRERVNKFMCVKQKLLWLTKCMCLPCCTWDFAAHWAVFVYKILKSMFCSKLHNSWPIFKIFTGCMEWTFRHPHMKYLSNQVILKFLHKFTNILEFNKFKRITMIAMWLSNYMVHNYYINNISKI